MQKGRQHTPFIAHMREWEPGEVFEAQRAIEDLVESPGWRVLSGLWEAARQAVEDRLKYSPTVPEQADLARALGIQVGFEEAMAAPEAVLILAAEVQEREERRAPAGAGV